MALPANPVDMAPFAGCAGDGAYTLFDGSVPAGDYELYLACDRNRNGHLDCALGGLDGPFDHLIVHVR